MVKTQLFIDMLEAGRVTSVTSAHGTSRTSRDVRIESAEWAKADIDQVTVTNPDFASTRPRSRIFARAVGSPVTRMRHFPTSWASESLFSNNLCSLRVFSD
jgi:hypothetical protein